MGIGEHIGCNVGENTGTSGKNTEPPFTGVGISSISGTITHGNTVVVSGGGFGVKLVAAPFKYDDFEDGTIGQKVSMTLKTPVWEQYTPGGETHVYSNTRSYNGSQSVVRYHDGVGDDFNTFGLKGLATEKAYFCTHIYIEGGFGPVEKIFRINAEPNFYTSRPSAYLTRIGSSFYCAAVDNNSNNVALLEQFDGADWDDAWVKLEIIMEYGVAGAGNDRLRVWKDNSLYYDSGLQNIRLSGAATIDNFLVTGSIDPGVPVYYYVDEAYIDTTPMRVEIGNASTYDTCTISTPQPATSWTDTTLGLTITDAGLNTGTNYMYVIDEDNNPIDTDGYAITVV